MFVAKERGETSRYVWFANERDSCLSLKSSELGKEDGSERGRGGKHFFFLNRDYSTVRYCREIRVECTASIEPAVLYIYEESYNLESQGTLQALEAKEPSTLGAKEPIYIRTYLNTPRSRRVGSDT
jgi:hypothetical protein